MDRWHKSTGAGARTATASKWHPSRLIALRDSKAPDSGVLFVNPAAWRAVLRCVRDRASS
ncbi:DUF397 domain-containing protein [Spirillospora sp. NPDC052269]